MNGLKMRYFSNVIFVVGFVDVVVNFVNMERRKVS